jgi:hypothetical protein
LLKASAWAVPQLSIDAVCFETPRIVREEWRKMGVDISDEQWNRYLDEVYSKIHAVLMTI